MKDPIRALVAAQLRLDADPAALTADDVSLLGEARFSLGLRAAVALEIRRALNATTTKTKGPSRRRAKR